MTIDYYGQFPCKVRECVSDAELSQMEKAQNRSETILDIMRNDPEVDKSLAEEDWTFRAIVRGPDGDEETEMRVGDLLSEAAPLEALAMHCLECPFNVLKTDFGCGGAINYPIQPSAEEWLLSRLPDDLTSVAGKLLTSGIADFNFDGEPIDSLRHRKEIYVADTPPVRQWGTGFFSKKARITSSQILHMTFCLGSLQPTHAKLLAYFLGFVNDKTELSEDPGIWPQDSDDAGIVQLKYFFIVAALAGLNNFPVLIDS